MIKKISKIKNFAVFRDFEWDRCVKAEDGNPQEFREINIIYGRNYSGKTSLSRILRAFETGAISEKYTNPVFTLSLEDGITLDQSKLKEHGLSLRIFNEDFVRENLRFISNPDEDIEPFAVLGENNNKLEAEIHALEQELGSEEPLQETGLYAKKVSKKTVADTASNSHRSAQQELDRLLTPKATGGQESIKYNSAKFGDQNYNRPKIEKDLSLVSNTTYQPLQNEKAEDLKKLLEERALPEIPELPNFDSNLHQLAEKAKTLLEREIGKSDKIQELLMDAVMNRWVQEGRTLHKNKRDTCGFCGNKISSERWTELNQHFDKESEEYEKQLDALISEVATDLEHIAKYFTLTRGKFYTRFHRAFEEIEKELKQCVSDYADCLKSIETQLKKRKDSILQSMEFSPVTDSSEALANAVVGMNQLLIEANKFTESLQDEQSDARSKLRLQEVYQFSKTIEYSKKLEIIKDLEEKRNIASKELTAIEEQIQSKKHSITAKRRQLNDEEEGARKVNDYLTHYFCHGFLKLESLEKEDPESGQKRIRFQVMRGDKVAHHLSEGECRLLAFCYFMAKLEDIETKGVKPILWIDDPISSLDGNHVFFVYSLLKAKVVDEGVFTQVFVSTHNLDFLKYLKRFRGCFINSRGKNQEYSRNFFLINRTGEDSEIRLMPKHLRDYVTEFNFLFHQIYKCASADESDELDAGVFYNFGNNARKFLEIFLYFKFPDSSADLEKLERFFGQGRVPAILTDRINNEYSHLSGGLERGSSPVVVPEMQSVARQIIEGLKRDEGQFNALLKSVGESLTVTEGITDAERSSQVAMQEQ